MLHRPFLPKSPYNFSVQRRQIFLLFKTRCGKPIYIHLLQKIWIVPENLNIGLDKNIRKNEIQIFFCRIPYLRTWGIPKYLIYQKIEKGAIFKKCYYPLKIQNKDWAIYSLTKCNIYFQPRQTLFDSFKKFSPCWIQNSLTFWS